MPSLNSFRYIRDIMRAMSTRYAKSDKFRVQINTPISISNPLSGAEFLCESVDFPFFTFNTSEQYYNSTHVNTVNGVDFDPITLTFLIDTGTTADISVIGAISAINNYVTGSSAAAKAITLFTNWSNAIRNTSGQVGYLNDYAGTLTIRLMDDNLIDLKTANINKAYPINADSLNLSRDSNEELLLLNVSFKYESITYS